MEKDTHESDLKPEGERTPPTAQDAARRLVILKYVVGHALLSPPRPVLEEWVQEWNAEVREEFALVARKKNKEFWLDLRDDGLWQHLSTWERDYAACTFVTMTHEDQIVGSWRIESLQTLMWALGLLSELPPYDTMADHELLKTIPREDVEGFIGSASLRPLPEIERARDIAEFWHWRSRTRRFIEQGEAFRPNKKLKELGLNTFEDIVRFAAHKGAEEGTIPPCIADDFPARGQAYRELSIEDWSEVNSITIERHFALNWLCGHAPGNRWEETPTDT